MKNKVPVIALLLAFVVFQSFVFSQIPAPTNLTATEITVMNHSVVKLEWQGSGNMERFNVYRKFGGLTQPGEFMRIANHIMHHDFIDPMVFPDSTYSYYVTTAVQTGESEPSDTVEITLNGNDSFATVSGVLTNEINNEPIVNGKVKFSAFNACFGITSMTNQSGEFVAHLLPGDYYVRSMAMGFYPEFYDNVPDIQQATLITLNSGDSISLNIPLTPFIPPTLYTLSGSVTDNSGNPLRARLEIFPVKMNSRFHHHNNRHVVTDSLGNYSIPVKEGDTLVVYCKPLNHDYQSEYFDNKENFSDADRIPVNGDITGINFSLDPVPVYTNGISGFVKNEGDSGVVAHITAFNLAGHHLTKYRSISDSLGNYELNNMVPGQYILLALPEEDYMPTFFRYDGEPTLNRHDADSVVVEENGVVPGINFIVRPFEQNGFANVTGIINDNSGNPVCGATVFAIDLNNNLVSYTISNANGQFNLEGFEPGSYRVVGDKFGFNSDQYTDVTLDYSNNTSQNISITLNPDGVTSAGNDQVMNSYRLNQNYPNPFNPSTSISYSIAKTEMVTIKVVDILGREVATLLNEVKPAGNYQLQFDASKLSSGVYFYKLQAGSFVDTKKMTLIK